MLSPKTFKKQLIYVINMNNKDFAKQYVQSRGLKETGTDKIWRIYNHYTDYQGESLEYLLDEADKEEEAGIRWKRRTLKQRLVNYMNYCKKEMLLSSARTYFNTIRSFYTHHEIEIGTLPKWNTRNANVPEPITSKDMLDKELIREALKVANPVMRCIILTEASSGMTRSDVLSLTVGDFIEATYPYHHSRDVQVAVKLMLESDVDMIPPIRLRRSKTNKYFITFLSPEATIEICKYLRLRDKRNHKYHRPLLSDVDQLFKISRKVYIDKFGEINTQLNGGKAGTYNRLRGHNLRKFHATSLERYGMSRDLVNVLQGKSNNNVDDVYFIEDEDHLRDEYLKAMEGVLIYTNVKEVNKYSIEYQQLEVENKEYKQKLDSILDRIAKLEDR
jgi:integrase